jgi:ParB family chromosome partitioning protein
MSTKPKLGKGLNSLLSNRHASEATESDGRRWVETSKLQANTEQPRKAVERGLPELAESLRRHGMMQPIVVTELPGGAFEILAGERRWRAAQLAGLKSVPVVLREGVRDGGERLELALIENIQREDLDPMERAQACERLLETYGLTQAQVAERLGYQRSTVANLVRLLELPTTIQEDVSRGTLSAGHARALLRLQGMPNQAEARELILKEEMSVRAAEALCAKWADGKGATPHRARPRKPAWAQDMQEKLNRRLGLRSELRLHAKGGGKLVLHFSDLDQLDRLSDDLGLRSEAEELLES